MSIFFARVGLGVLAMVTILAATAGAQRPWRRPEPLHVSPDGDDAAAGTGAAPLRTIQEAADRLQPGQTCIVHAGTYAETVRPPKLQTDGKAVCFLAAEGEMPVITGADPVENWAVWRGGIHRARVAEPVDQLFLDGRAQTLARRPNAGDDPFAPATIEMQADGLTVTAEKLKIQPGDLDGATLWALSSRKWVAGTAKITGSGPGKLTLDRKVPFWSKGVGWGYVEGLVGLIDAPGEWAWADGWLYFLPPEGVELSDRSITVPRRRWAFDLSGRTDVLVRGFRIVAASVNTDRASNCRIDRCRFRWASWRRDIRGGFNRDKGMDIESEGLGVVLGGKGNVLSNSEVAYAWGDGVSVYGRDNRVVNCVVHHINASASDCAPIDATGRGHAILDNTVFNAGRSGILHRKLAAGRIERNHIHHVGLMTTDLGGTYTFTTRGEGTVIAHNRIHDVRCKTGVGIYIDNICDDFLIHHNVCYDNQDSGIRINTPARKIRVYHNTLARNGNAMNWWGKNNNSSMPGVEVINNILLGTVRLGEEAEIRDNFMQGQARFVAPEKGNFRLQPGSPCIDAVQALPGVTGKVVGARADAGAYERGADTWTAGTALDPETWDRGGW